MNKSKIKKPTSQKLKSICLRVTDEELQQLNMKSQSNHQTRSTYILNQCLSENQSNIYTKKFMDTVMKVSDLANNLQSDTTAVKEEIILLREEVGKLWLSLK